MRLLAHALLLAALGGCATAPAVRPEWIDRPYDDESMPGCVLVVGCGSGATREIAQRTALDDALKQTARSMQTIVDSEFAEIERVFDQRDGVGVGGADIVRNSYERTS